MSILKEVTVSGTVGKQVYRDSVAAAAASGEIQKVVLKSVIIAGITSGALVTIRSGNASGDVLLTAGAVKYDSRSHCLHDVRCDKGLHVKVLGTGSICYLVIE